MLNKLKKKIKKILLGENRIIARHYETIDVTVYFLGCQELNPPIVVRVYPTAYNSPFGTGLKKSAASKLEEWLDRPYLLIADEGEENGEAVVYPWHKIDRIETCFGPDVEFYFEIEPRFVMDLVVDCGWIDENGFTQSLRKE